MSQSSWRDGSILSPMYDLLKLLFVETSILELGWPLEYYANHVQQVWDFITGSLKRFYLRNAIDYGEAPYVNRYFVARSCKCSSFISLASMKFWSISISSAVGREGLGTPLGTISESSFWVSFCRSSKRSKARRPWADARSCSHSSFQHSNQRLLRPFPWTLTWRVRDKLRNCNATIKIGWF